jgi:hypothetical protein
MGKRIDPGDVWVLTFVPAPGFTAAMSMRIRRLLKAALRSFGCRCVRVRGPDAAELRDAEADADQDNLDAGG